MEARPTAKATGSIPGADLERCCKQCGAAASRDPSGTDISVKPCASYAPGIDEDCLAYFRSQRTLVSDCRRLNE